MRISLLNQKACHQEKHAIRLMEGAQPINMRPYRHKLELKTEIEAQIAKLLATAVLQKSKSPFSCAPLFVKKNDGTW